MTKFCVFRLNVRDDYEFLGFVEAIDLDIAKFKARQLWGHFDLINC